MQLPDWMPTMRRRPKDIKVKDFVSPETQRALVKAVTPAGAKLTRINNTPERLLDYLKEPHTKKEVKEHFGYATESTAYYAIWALLKKNQVMHKGDGLYVSSKTGIETFNIGDLDEKILQEKGLEAFQKNFQNKKPDKIISKRHLSISNRKRLNEAILEYCAVPRTSAEIAHKFGYAKVSSLSWGLQHSKNGTSLVEQGKIVRVPTKRGNGFTWQTVNAIVTEAEPLEAPKTTTYQDIKWKGTETTDFEPAVTQNDIEELAKRYLWEAKTDNFLSTDTLIVVLRGFVKWVKEQENK